MKSVFHFNLLHSHAFLGYCDYCQAFKEYLLDHFHDYISPPSFINKA